MPGLFCCTWTFSGCGERGLLLFIVVLGLLTAVATLAGEPQLWGASFSNASTEALLPHSMWNLPRPGIEPTSLALAGRFLTTGPPGKSRELNGF